MIIQNLLVSDENYTHEGWVYNDIFVHFSRFYYILDGEAYYQEGDRIIPLRQGHLYLTPVRKKFSLFENEQNKLLHTYAHLTTIPPVTQLIEVEVVPNTCLYDAVMLWRKYNAEGDPDTIANILQLILSCLEGRSDTINRIAHSTKQFLDSYPTFNLNLDMLSKHVGYSKVHINRLFFESYKTTPMKYFNDRRLNLGLKKMLEGVPAKEVSLLLNYASPAAFSKAFKQKFGLSPEKYSVILGDQE